MKALVLFALAALFFAETPALGISQPTQTSAVHRTVTDAKKKINTPHFSFHELYNMTTNFFDNFAYPNNVVQAKLINSTLFAEDCLGRVDVTRNFLGQELNTEYAFGLFSNIALNPTAFTLLGVPVKYDIIHFAANENIISVALIVDFNITALGVINPVEVDFWATFNAQGQIDQYDATFRFLQWQFDSLMEVGQQLLQLNTTAEVEKVVGSKLANSICSTAQTYCTGPNKQYGSLADCYHYLTQKVPFGQAYEMGMNTILCRMIHQNMVPYRPTVHCPHIGRTGGGYCTNNRNYAENVRQPLFTNHPFVPHGYENVDADIAAQ